MSNRARQKPGEHVRIQEKDVSRTREMSRVGVKRQVLVWLHLNSLQGLDQATRLPALWRSQLHCCPLRAAFPGHSAQGSLSVALSHSLQGLLICLFLSVGSAFLADSAFPQQPGQCPHTRSSWLLSCRQPPSSQPHPCSHSPGSQRWDHFHQSFLPNTHGSSGPQIRGPRMGGSEVSASLDGGLPFSSSGR